MISAQGLWDTQACIAIQVGGIGTGIAGVNRCGFVTSCASSGSGQLATTRVRTLKITRASAGSLDA